MNEVPYLESTSVSSAPTHAISDSCLNHLETSISSSLHSTPTATALIQACRISCLVVQLYLTLCDPMDYSMSGFPVLNHFLEFARTHVHWVGDDIQPSHPLSSPSPPAFNLSQHQSLFQWVSVLPMNIWRWLQDWLISLLSKGLSSSPAPQFKSINSLAFSLFYCPVLTSAHWKNHSFD